jgi:non-heme chloroperoxidase
LSEKIFAFLLRLYPSSFRKEYETEALQIFRDRLQNERGLFRRARLWCDLARDFVSGLTLAYQYSRESGDRRALAASAGAVPSFGTLEEEPVDRMAMLLGSAMSLIGVAVFASLLTAPVHLRPLVGPHGQLSAVVAVMERLNQPLPAADQSVPKAAREEPIPVARKRTEAPVVVPASTAPLAVASLQPAILTKDNHPAEGAASPGPQNATMVGTKSSGSPAGSTTRMLEVEPGVKLEVLDWGGSGRALVLLAGKGFTAHEFDEYAPKLSAQYHVYGITRRGYGKSSMPPTTDENYSADRLADDVLAVLDQLRLDRPVLVGHSIAGEEMSSIGTRAPNKVAGLVYLDAGYAYAFYNPATGYLTVDYNTLRRQLDHFTALAPMKERKQSMAELAESLSRFEKSLGGFRDRLAHAPDDTPAPPDTAETHVDIAMFRGEQRFGGVSCPVLAIYADPHSFGDQFKNNQDALKAAQAADHADISTQADAFSKANPQAVVLRIPNADHFVFRSNEVEVTKALNDFVRTLP